MATSLNDLSANFRFLIFAEMVSISRSELGVADFVVVLVLACFGDSGKFLSNQLCHADTSSWSKTMVLEKPFCGIYPGALMPRPKLNFLVALEVNFASMSLPTIS